MKAMILLLVVACVSAEPDWSQRVGSYTYKEAVINYEPPDSMNEFKDGTTVASWVLRRHPNWQDKLILVFDKNRKLVSGHEKRF